VGEDDGRELAVDSGPLGTGALRSANFEI
jgi:hypothetical protein